MLTGEVAHPRFFLDPVRFGSSGAARGEMSVVFQTVLKFTFERI